VLRGREDDRHVGTEVPHLVHGQRECSAGAGHELDLAGRLRITASDVGHDGLADLLELDAAVSEEPRCRSLVLPEQPEEL
jgi:hypothetical protein